MRKKIIGGEVAGEEPSEITPAKWFDLDAIAAVEVTSEDPGFPIENALGSHVESKAERGWRAAAPGPQTIRLHFDAPHRIRRILVRFIDRSQERGQEFVLRYSADGDKAARDVVRQQWTFTPDISVEELEDYSVDLSGVSILELIIDPDRGTGNAFAVLSELRVG